METEQVQVNAALPTVENFTRASQEENANQANGQLQTPVTIVTSNEPNTSTAAAEDEAKTAKQTTAQSLRLIWIKYVKSSFREAPNSIFGSFSLSQVGCIAGAEALGTMLLLFFGCMGGAPGLGISHLQACLTFGFVVGAIIQMIGHISKAHLNPAVTAAAIILDNLKLPLAGVYIVSQCLGAVVGFGLLKMLTPEDFVMDPLTNSTCTFCTTIPSPKISSMQAVNIEFMATCALIFVLCGCWDHRNSHLGDSIPIKFALTIAGLALAAGPYTGCSMNPARSFAPALWNGNWERHWVYWVGPITAGFLMASLYRLVFERNPPKPKTNTKQEEPHVEETPLTQVIDGEASRERKIDS